MPSQPPVQVLAAFGVAGSALVALEGGQSTSWRAGDLVLKPAQSDPDELAWQARVFSQIRQDGFRLAQPRPAADGSWSVDGWSAADFAPGRHRQRRWLDIIAVGDRLHRALRSVRRPAFLRRRSDRWSTADSVAWGEIPATAFPAVPHLPELSAALRPVDATSQVIHGDLTGNVLFHDRLPPAIIDFPPYWRPVPYSAAIVIADALVWEGAADHQIMRAVNHFDDFGQYLARALIFRIVTDWILASGEPREPLSPEPDPWAHAVELAGHLASAARSR
jgi:uncharacterized protein (TIGR02569 family)